MVLLYLVIAVIVLLILSRGNLANLSKFSNIIGALLWPVSALFLLVRASNQQQQGKSNDDNNKQA